MNNKLFYAILTFAFCFLPHVTEAPIWSSAITLILIAMALYVSRTGKILISRRGIKALTFVLLALVWLQFKTILGPEPASALLCMLVALKLHEVDSSRDEQVILILNTLVVMCWTLFSQSLFTTIYMITALLLVGVGLIAIQTPNRSIKQIVFNTPMRIGLDILLALPLFLLFFFLFPRFSTPLSNLFANQQTQTGFSEDLTPGMWADLVQSDEVAFRVLFNDRRVRANQLYWRGLVLGETTGFSWQRATRTQAREVNEAVESDVQYEIILEPRYGRTVFHLESATGLKIKEAQTQVRNRVIPRGNYYELASLNPFRLSLLGSANLSRPLYLDEPTNRDILLPDNISTEVKALATKLKVVGAPTETAKNVFDYFSKNNFQYSTTTAEMARLDDFIFRFKAGFCEHYAAAFAILMRAAGVPARVVIGFQGGEYNNYGNYLIVRDRNAHAWNEIYIEGQGWVRFDPTTAVNSTRIETGDFISPLFAGLDRNSTLVQNLQIALNYIEAINTQYIMFLLNFNSEMQFDWLSSVGLPNITKLQLFYAFVLVIVIFIFIAYWLIYRRSSRSAPLNRGYSLLLNRLAKMGINKLPQEGPSTFLNRLEKGELNSRNDLNIHKKLLVEYISLAYSPSHENEHLEFLKQTERL
ncbi:MAG: DUF3488 and transglutaminase-like domain-containing protein [Bdellovibrionota bacterium]